MSRETLIKFFIVFGLVLVVYFAGRAHGLRDGLAICERARAGVR